MISVRKRLIPALAAIILVLVVAGSAWAFDFVFTNITDLPGGPGHGSAPSINNQGDIAFVVDDTVFVHDLGDASFLNLMSLPAPRPAAGTPA